MCRETLGLTGDHVLQEPAGATVYAGGFGCLVSEPRQLHTFMQIALRGQKTWITVKPSLSDELRFLI